MATVLNPPLTAHDRLKASFWSYVWAATAFSALAHFAVLRIAEFGSLPDYGIQGVGELEQVVLEEQQTYDVPPPPERIGRPAVPVLSTDVNLSSDITIGEIDFDEIPVADVPPPPTAVAVDHSAEPSFTPYEIRPTLVNGTEVERALLTYYPTAYKSAGVGGITTLWIYIDESGHVQNTRVVVSSGFAELDAVAERVMRESARFSPAFNRDTRVPVWIQIPVTFEAKKLKVAG